MLTPEELAAIREREGKATEGPWQSCVFAPPDGDGVEMGVFCPDDPRSYSKPDGTWHGLSICRGATGDNRANNMEYVANARTDIPDLLAHIEEQAGRIRELEADGERLDWLERKGFATVKPLSDSEPDFGVSAWHVMSSDPWTWNAHFISSYFRTARAAIDAARSEVPHA